MRWYIAMIQYLAIFVTIVAVCDAVDENLIAQTADERIKSINPKSTLANRIPVDLYYAALCSDARNFIVTQLVPVYEELGNYIDVTYIPYGRGVQEKVTYQNGTERWNFTCQFGEPGCHGNKAHACAIDEILTSPQVSNEQQALVNFVGCVMSSSNPVLAAVPQCLTTIGLNATSISSVNNCLESTKADDLKAAYGDRTHAMQPPFNFVPTIITNKVYSQENRDKALADFRSLVCEYIPVANRPLVCTNATNGSTSLHSTRNLIAITIFSLLVVIGKGPNYLY